MRRIATLAVCTSFALSACGGSSDIASSQVLEQRVIAKSQSLLDVSNTVLEYDTLPEANVPTTGTASFVGSVGILVDTKPQITNIVGDASVTLDFGANAVSGAMDNFVGLDANRNAVSYDGSVEFTGGEVRLIESTVFLANYKGDLTSGETSIGIEGSALGILKGDAENFAIQAAATTPVSVDGVATDATMSIAAVKE